VSVLVVVGASFRTAPIEVRERLALTGARNRCLVAGVTQTGDADEAIAVSTCNRTELYLVGSDAGRLAQLGVAELCAIGGEHDPIPASAFFVHRGEHAAQHVYRVAAGLDAVVKGEAEVLGQVREALALARVERTAGPILSRLFESANETARRVRNETAVGRTAVSVGSIAAGLAGQTLGRLDGATVLVIGAGQTAEIVVTSLVARGAGSVRVVNRTVDRALDLSRRFGGTAGTMDRLEQELAAADVVVSATHAPHHLVTPELVGDRSARPLLAIDLAVPRDIDPAVRELPGVALYDIDALESVVARNRSAREGEAVAGEEIVALRAAEFQRWLTALDVVPAITGLRALGEQIRREELDRVSGRFENLSPRDRAVLEQLTRSIVNKLLHEPTVRMKDGPEFAQTVRDLFDLGSP
jgi:glutamyl-tRNA reductase